MRPRNRFGLVLVLAAMMAPWPRASAVATEYLPEIVVPGRPGVPVMWFGRDISGAVIEGDWGLSRPGHGVVTIIPAGPRLLWEPGPGGGYYPATGHAPRYGRREVEPPANRPLPPPAESFHQRWGAHSGSAPATSPSTYDGPPILIGPQPDPSPRNFRRAPRGGN
jgi:hypothetical protein